MNPPSACVAGVVATVNTTALDVPDALAPNGMPRQAADVDDSHDVELQALSLAPDPLSNRAEGDTSVMPKFSPEATALAVADDAALVGAKDVTTGP